jgi:uptake hydrogenase small subunit
MKYLGFMPKEAPTGESALGYFVKASIEKAWPKNNAVTEGSK